MAKQAGQQQLDSMKRLSQQAAAWLIGRSARALRDDPSAPRNKDGSYDGRELVRWFLQGLGQPELDDEKLERCLLIAEELYGELPHPAPMIDVLRALQDEHGAAGLAAFATVLLDELGDLADRDRDELREPTEAEQRQLEQQRREQDQRGRARARLEVAIVCEGCGKLRRGRRWIRRNPPDGYVVLKGRCPTCPSA